MTFQKCNVNLKVHQSEFKVSVLILGIWLLHTLHWKFLKGCLGWKTAIHCSVPACPNQDDCICFSVLLVAIHFLLSSWKRRGSKHTVSVTSSWLLEKRSTIFVVIWSMTRRKHFHPVAIHWIINSFIPLEFTRHSSLFWCSHLPEFTLYCKISLLIIIEHLIHCLNEILLLFSWCFRSPDFLKLLLHFYHIPGTKNIR